MNPLLAALLLKHGPELMAALQGPLQEFAQKNAASLQEMLGHLTGGQPNPVNSLLSLFSAPHQSTIQQSATLERIAVALERIAAVYGAPPTSGSIPPAAQKRASQ